MKKTLSFTLALVMLFSLSTTAFATEITGDSGSVDITYTYEAPPDTYIVTIPDSMTIGTDANVTVSDVSISESTMLSVSVSSSQYSGGWKLTNGDDAVGYTIKIDGTDIENNATLITVGNGESASTTLVTALAGTPKYSGSYTDTLTFTVNASYKVSYEASASGATWTLNVPENVYEPSIAEALETISGNADITTVVVNGSVTDSQYDTIKSNTSGKAVYFVNENANNYISSTGNTYTCTIGSVSNDKYVLIANNWRSDYEEKLGASGGNGKYSRYVNTLTTTDPGARAISASETAWSVYQSMVLSEERSEDVTNLLLGDTKRGFYKESENWWYIGDWNGQWTQRTFYWFPVFDVPLS